MKKKAFRLGGLLRMSLVALVILAQLFVIIMIVMHLRSNAIYLFLLLEIGGLIEAVLLIDDDVAISYKMAWTIIILFLPVFGWILYLLWGKASKKGKKSRRIQAIINRTQQRLWTVAPGREAVSCLPQHRQRISRYLANEGFPVYHHTDCLYFDQGVKLFEKLMDDLNKATEFIFMEFFIVSDGRLWQQIYSILKKKADAGVEVRFLYDDMGSIFNLPEPLSMAVTADHKIKVAAFNPIHHSISEFYLNYRNHRKTVVIDGHIGYTGGVNLADEYANYYQKLGHWKDTGVRLCGDAVWSLTVSFLQLWHVEAEGSKQPSWQRFRPQRQIDAPGYFQPFVDGPVNNPRNPAEDLYRQIICQAQQYIYITTPYLVIDDAMASDLCTAAQSGLDVRIITPKIADRWFVHIVTRSNYGRLLRHGVKIFEYTPGYIHAKTILSDDDHAVTGSINMDYRSFHLHFESGIWIADAPVLKDIKQDFLNTCAMSEQMSYELWKNKPWYLKPVQTILRLFSPLM